MKTKLFLSIALTAFTSFSTFAQVTGAPALTPGATNVSPVSPGFNSIFGGMFSNQSGTNAVPANFDTGLATLQNDIQQLLPLLASFNDGVDLSASSGAIQSSATNGVVGSTTSAAVSGQNSSTRVSNDFSTLLSRDVATRTAGTSANSSLSAAISTPSQPAVVSNPAGMNNPFGLAPGGGPITTNAFGTPVTARDVVRDLIVLQNDLERLLPVLVTLNGSSVPVGFTNIVGGIK